MRNDIAFPSDGVTLRGWLYRPDDRPGDRPAIVMAHGFSATKEMYLDDFAEVFDAAGFAVMVYDHRNFGDSDGEPRGEIDPVAQIRGYRDAITWLQDQKGPRAPVPAAQRLCHRRSYQGPLPRAQRCSRL